MPKRAKQHSRAIDDYQIQDERRYTQKYQPPTEVFSSLSPSCNSPMHQLGSTPQLSGRHNRSCVRQVVCMHNRPYILGYNCIRG
jgi:hypothetical protein